MNFEEQGWGPPKPILTEPGVKYFLNNALKQSHIIREKFYNTIFVTYNLKCNYFIFI